MPSYRMFSYIPNDPSSCTRRRSAARPPTPGLTQSVLFPGYPHSTTIAHDAHSDSISLASTSLISDTTTEARRQRSKNYNATEEVALAWAKKRIVLNSVTTTGWLRNITATEKKAKDTYITELINEANARFGCELETSPKVIEIIYRALLLDQRRLSKTSENLIDPYGIQPPSDSNLSDLDQKAFKDRRQDELLDSTSLFTYYLHGREVTDLSVFIILFANPVVEDAHIRHWYTSKDTPLRDEDMRSEIKTTPPLMLSKSAVSVMLAIRRAVSGKTSQSGAPLRFSTIPYADEQDAVNEAILLALASPIHGPAAEARFLYLHQRGIGALRGAIGLEAPVKMIVTPLSEEDSRIIFEALQHARATGLLLPQINKDLAMAGSHGPPTADYSKSVYIPSSPEELSIPRVDIVPPSTVHPQMSAAAHLSEVVVPSTSTDFSMPSESVHVELPYNFGDDFFDFPETYPLNAEHDPRLRFGEGGYYIL